MKWVQTRIMRVPGVWGLAFLLVAMATGCGKQGAEPAAAPAPAAPASALTETAAVEGDTAVVTETQPGKEGSAGRGKVIEKDEAATPPLIDLWASFYIGDSKVRFAHAEAHMDSLDGMELIKLVESHRARTRSALQGHVFETQETIEIWMRPADLGVVQMISTSKERERVSTTTVRLQPDGNEMVVTSELAGVSHDKSFAVPEVVVGSNDLLMKRLFDEGKLVSGFTHTFYELDLSVPEAREKTLVVRSAEEGGGVQVAFDDVSLLLGEDGLLVEGYYGDLRIRAEPFGVAREWGDQIFSANDRMNLDYLVPALPGIEGVVVDITVDGDPRGDVFQPRDYQEVIAIDTDEDSTTYRLILKPYRVRPAGEASFPLELSDEEREELGQYLEPDSLVQSDAPLIVDAAARATRGARSAYDAVAKLQRFVSYSLNQSYTEIANLSAVEALEQGRGDCAEHAVLFTALARAAGLPTRQCSGYVFWGTRGGRHAWNQVKLGDEWMHVDCIGRLLAAGPQYIQFYEETPDGSADREMSRRLHVLSTCDSTTRVTGFLRRGNIVPLSEKEKRGGYASASRYRHPFAGLMVDAPEGLRITSASNSFHPRLELSGSGLTVQISVESEAAESLLTEFMRSRDGAAGTSDLELVEGTLGNSETLAPHDLIVAGRSAQGGAYLDEELGHRELWVTRLEGSSCLRIEIAPASDVDHEAARKALTALGAGISFEE